MRKSSEPGKESFIDAIMGVISVSWIGVAISIFGKPGWSPAITFEHQFPLTKEALVERSLGH